MKTGDLVKIENSDTGVSYKNYSNTASNIVLYPTENSDILGLILSPPRKRYMIGQAALVFWNGEKKYVLENKLTLVENEND